MSGSCSFYNEFSPGNSGTSRYLSGLASAKNRADKNDVLCILPPKHINTRGLSEINQNVLDTGIEVGCSAIGKIKNSRKYTPEKLFNIKDFVIVGGGNLGEKCGVAAVTKIHPYGISCGVDNLSCKRRECPECAPYYVVKTAKEIAFKLECYARSHKNERPHAITVSAHPDVEASWDWNNFKMSLFRRGVRHMRGMGIAGGVKIGHPYRLKKGVVKKFREKFADEPDQYEMGTAGKGFWGRMRKDELGLGGWRNYVRPGFHEHCIGFPGFVKEHKSNDLLIKKYTVLEDVESLVKHLLYLVGHSGIAKTESGTKDSTKWWGFLNKNSKIPAPYEPEYENSYVKYADQVSSSEEPFGFDAELKILKWEEKRRVKRENEISFAEKWFFDEDALSEDEKAGIRQEIEDVVDGLDGIKKKETRVKLCPVSGDLIENFFAARLLPFYIRDPGWQLDVIEHNGKALGDSLLSDLELMSNCIDDDGDFVLDDVYKAAGRKGFSALCVFRLSLVPDETDNCPVDAPSNEGDKGG